MNNKLITIYSAIENISTALVFLTGFCAGGMTTLLIVSRFIFGSR